MLSLLSAVLVGSMYFMQQHTPPADSNICCELDQRPACVLVMQSIELFIQAANISTRNCATSDTYTHAF